MCSPLYCSCLMVGFWIFDVFCGIGEGGDKGEGAGGILQELDD